MPTSPGLNTGVLWGPLRISAVATAAGGEPVAETIEVPPTLEVPFKYHEIGAVIIGDLTFLVSRQDLKFTFTTAHAAQTAYPLVHFIRGTAGGLARFVPSVRLAKVPDEQSPGVWPTNNYTLAAGDDFYAISGGMLFDHTIAHAAGVTSPATSTPIQVGAVSATQTLYFLIANPHSPTPTWVGGAAQLESDPIEAFTTATLRGAAVTGMGSTASYSLQTVSGPITDTWWRLNIPSITSGAGFPVCCMWIVDN